MEKFELAQREVENKKQELDELEDFHRTKLKEFKKRDDYFQTAWRAVKELLDEKYKETLYYLKTIDADQEFYRILNREMESYQIMSEEVLVQAQRTLELEVLKEEENFQTKYYTYIVNDEFEIAEFKSGSDSYLPNNGSRIRSVRKKATDLSYKTLNIRKLFNSLLGFDIDINKIDEIFKSDYHNVRWGYTGPSKPSKQSIIEKLQQIYYEYTK